MKNDKLECKIEDKIDWKIKIGSVRRIFVCEEYGHLDLKDIRQYRTPPRPI
jgi:hypothetical protein